MARTLAFGPTHHDSHTELFMKHVLDLRFPSLEPFRIFDRRPMLLFVRQALENFWEEAQITEVHNLGDVHAVLHDDTDAFKDAHEHSLREAVREFLELQENVGVAFHNAVVDAHASSLFIVIDAGARLDGFSPDQAQAVMDQVLLGLIVQYENARRGEEGSTWVTLTAEEIGARLSSEWADDER